MNFGPNFTNSKSFKGRVPEKAKMSKKTYLIKKIPLIFKTPPKFLICCIGSSTV